MSGRCRTREIVNPIQWASHFNGIADICLKETEAGMSQERSNVGNVAGHHVVEANDAVTFAD
jgi:hypothetical protein